MSFEHARPVDPSGDPARFATATLSGDIIVEYIIV